MIKTLTKQEMAQKIANGIASKLWADYDTVKCSQKNSFPVIGVGCWTGDRADRILNDIGNGHKYMDTSYSTLSKGDELDDLKCLLSSDESHLIQDKYLAEDSAHCVDRITHHDHLVDPSCIIYAGLWCVPDTEKVVYFIKHIPEEIDKNNLEQLHLYFSDNFSVNSHIGYDSGAVEFLAGKFYHYVASL
jgi:hypothetical protein